MNEHGEVQTPGIINWSDEDPKAVKGYGEQIAEIKAHYSTDPVVPDGHVVTSNHEENAAKFFSAHPDQIKSRVMRGRTQHFATLEDIGYMADSKWGGEPLDEKTKAYYATFPAEKIAGLQELAGAMREAEKRVEYVESGETEFDADKALDELEESGALDLFDKESEAQYLNEQLVAAGRAPVYSAAMLSALDAAERRKKQKQNRKKKSKR